MLFLILWRKTTWHEFFCSILICFLLLFRQCFLLSLILNVINCAYRSVWLLTNCKILILLRS
jgi:hypothetical protein